MFQRKLFVEWTHILDGGRIRNAYMFQWVKYKFIKKHFHQKIQFHQNPLSSKIKLRVGTEPNTIGMGRFHRNTAYARLSGFNRPSRGASSAEGWGSGV